MNRHWRTKLSKVCLFRLQTKVTLKIGRYLFISFVDLSINNKYYALLYWFLVIIIFFFNLFHISSIHSRILVFISEGAIPCIFSLTKKVFSSYLPLTNYEKNIDLFPMYSFHVNVFSRGLPGLFPRGCWPPVVSAYALWALGSKDLYSRFRGRFEPIKHAIENI